MRRIRLMLSLVFILLLAHPSHGEIIVQTFDELPFQPINGLSYRGVTFGYYLDGDPSDDAKYASFGPVETEHVTDPSLIGDSRGMLTVDFDAPTTVIEFGVALSSTGPVSDGITVELRDAAMSTLAILSQGTTESSSATGFSDAMFHYEGAAISRMVVNFADDPGSFAFDNLAYVPEPRMLSQWFVAVLIVLAGAFRIK